MLIKRNADNDNEERIAKRVSREQSVVEDINMRKRGKRYGICAREDCEQGSDNPDNRHYQCKVCSR